MERHAVRAGSRLRVGDRYASYLAKRNALDVVDEKILGFGRGRGV